jgi:DNA-binding NarL/FixJ family response regulator
VTTSSQAQHSVFLTGLPATVTTAELRVLQLAGTSTLCNKELADRLHLSVSCVKAHLRSIYRKLGLRGGPHCRVKLLHWCLARENANQ